MFCSFFLVLLYFAIVYWMCKQKEYGVYVTRSTGDSKWVKEMECIKANKKNVTIGWCCCVLIYLIFRYHPIPHGHSIYSRTLGVVISNKKKENQNKKKTDTDTESLSYHCIFMFHICIRTYLFCECFMIKILNPKDNNLFMKI